jgi:hypothetical protein
MKGDGMILEFAILSLEIGGNVCVYIYIYALRMPKLGIGCTMDVVPPSCIIHILRFRLNSLMACSSNDNVMRCFETAISLKVQLKL